MITYQESQIKKALELLDKLYARGVYDSTTQIQIRRIIGVLDQGVNK